MSCCDEPFPFDLFVVCTFAYHIFVVHIACWFPMDWLLLLRDRELVSSCNLVLT